MDDEIRARLGRHRQDHGRLPLGRPDRHRRPRDRQASRRRARSSSSRPRPTIPTPTSSRRCSRSPTTRAAEPEPYHIVAEIRDAREPRRRPAGRRRRGPAHPGRRPDRADHRPDLPPGRACRSSTPSCSTSTATRSTSRRLPELVGRTFGDALLAFEDSTLHRPPRRPAATPKLNPPMDTVIGAGRRASSSSARTTTRSGWRASRRRSDEAAIRIVEPAPAAPERTLVLGWNRRAPTIIRELDGYVAAGSEVVVVADLPDVGGGPRRARGRRSPTRRSGSSGPTRPAGRVLERLDVPSFDHIVVLCYSDTLDDPAGRRADDHHAPPPARHGGAGRPRLLDRVRDARPAQPRAGRGHPRRRLHRQRPAGQPADGPGRRERPPQRGLRRPVRPGRLGDLPAAGGRLRRAAASRSRSRRSSSRPGGAARSPSATASSRRAGVVRRPRASRSTRPSRAA